MHARSYIIIYQTKPTYDHVSLGFIIIQKQQLVKSYFW